ncbi:MAG: fluoride efflux transporter CrcB [Clostridiales Family XIII bacterium]|jgi:CrcB protein|nr:fluoride efflux transporter CrcB [Clostridiales Family XIII bacterium]
MKYMELIAVGSGGFLGACARFLLTKAFDMAGADLPLGTLASNVIAGFLIGLIIGLERHMGNFDRHAKLFLTTGLLGGLSTFSAFSLETVTFLQAKQYLYAAGNTVLNLACSIIAVFLGFALAKLWETNSQ